MTNTPVFVSPYRYAEDIRGALAAGLPGQGYRETTPAPRGKRENIAFCYDTLEILMAFPNTVNAESP